MGDRYFDTRHPNLEFMLRRMDGFLAGIGHNGGPPLVDMSWGAWIWRKAAAKAWATPPREIMLRRLARAERLGLSYRAYTAALLDTGTNLSTALLPLHHLHDGVGFAPRLVAAVSRFGGRLFVVADGVVSGRVTPVQRRSLLAWLNAEFDGRVEAVLALPFHADDSDARRAQRLRALLKQHNALRKECFWLGSTPAENQLAEAAGLGWFQPLARWFEEGEAA
ncbi:MAG: hypothetical protein VW600_03730 [Ferrovibrio sp.]